MPCSNRYATIANCEIRIHVPWLSDSVLSAAVGKGSPNLRFGIIGDDSRYHDAPPNRRRDSEPVNDVEDVHRETAGLLGTSVRSTARADVGTEHHRSDLRHAPAI
jgi:hypothetical protein